MNQQVIEIPKGAPDCPTAAAHMPFKITQKGVCVMTLIGNQHTVVGATDLVGGRSPGLRSCPTRPRRSALMRTSPTRMPARTATTAIYTLTTVASGNPMLVFAAAALGTVVGLQRHASGGILALMLTHITWSSVLLLALPPLFR